MQLKIKCMLLAATLLPVPTTVADLQIPLGADNPIPSGAPTVRLANGTYYGRYSTEYEQDYFLGVPFAQPPVGTLRFAPPQSLNKTFDEARNATAYGPECIGYGYDQWILGNRVSEDCLTINIVRPSGTSEGDDLPVAIWIHGGGFRNGGGLDPRYNLSFIVAESVRLGTPMIAASIQYRLSNWGWMFGRELANEGAGNLGLRDQRLALHWVQENIAAFGGNPEKVTIWGESAGAFSVGYHLVAYGGRDDGLFRSAILQSGSPAMRMTSAAEWQPYFDAVAGETECAAEHDVLNCMRALPWETLNNVFNSTTFPVEVPGIGAVLDGDIMPDQGSALLRQGKFVPVSVLMGINTDEGASFGRQGINTTTQFLDYVRSAGADEETAMKIGALYPDDPEAGLPATLSGRPEPYPWGLQWKRVVAFHGDVLFHSGRRLMAEAFAKAGALVYSYRFNVLVNGVLSHHGSSHFKEVAFVFHNTRGDGYDLPGGAASPLAGKGPEYTQLAHVMSRAWVAFIAGGDPNGHIASNACIGDATNVYEPNELKLTRERDAGFVTISPCLNWPLYTSEKPMNIVFDVNVTNLMYAEKDDFRKQEMAFVNEIWHP